MDFYILKMMMMFEPFLLLKAIVKYIVRVQSEKIMDKNEIHNKFFRIF